MQQIPTYSVTVISPSGQIKTAPALEGGSYTILEMIETVYDRNVPKTVLSKNGKENTFTINNVKYQLSDNYNLQSDVSLRFSAPVSGA